MPQAVENVVAPTQAGRCVDLVIRHAGQKRAPCRKVGRAGAGLARQGDDCRVRGKDALDFRDRIGRQRQRLYPGGKVIGKDEAAGQAGSRRVVERGIAFMDVDAARALAHGDQAGETIELRCLAPFLPVDRDSPNRYRQAAAEQQPACRSRPAPRRECRRGQHA